MTRTALVLLCLTSHTAWADPPAPLQSRGKTADQNLQRLKAGVLPLAVAFVKEYGTCDEITKGKVLLDFCDRIDEAHAKLTLRLGAEGKDQETLTIYLTRLGTVWTCERYDCTWFRAGGPDRTILFDDKVLLGRGVYNQGMQKIALNLMNRLDQRTE